MKLPAFEYVRPKSVEEVLGYLRLENARPLAGGQSLLPVLALRLARTSLLVDLSDVDELAGISVTDRCEVRLGAMTRQSDVLDSRLVQEGFPLVARAVASIAHEEIRHRSTVGGSLAHADPSAEWPALAVALDATIEVASRVGRRDVAAVDFFRGPFTTSLNEGELVVAVRLPPQSMTGSGFYEVTRRAGGVALAGAMLTLQVEAGRVQRASVTLFAAVGTPLKCEAAAAALVGTSRASGTSLLAPTLPQVGNTAGDIGVESDYRRHLLVTAATRALDEAWDTA